VDVYLELGKKRVFAAALEWPGWCRGGKDEESALQALLDYGPRYGAVVSRLERALKVPAAIDKLKVTERLAGDATTDFGAPGAIPATDSKAISGAELERLLSLLEACWSEFEGAAKSAKGKLLASGPRGGGRNLDKIREHVMGAHDSYARKLGGSDDFVAAARARWRGEVPDVGPRGGSRWPPRYAIRRAAWHILDHAWEIEDRSTARRA
jgi:hypothetical protein